MSKKKNKLKLLISQRLKQLENPKYVSKNNETQISESYSPKQKIKIKKDKIKQDILEEPEKEIKESNFKEAKYFKTDLIRVLSYFGIIIVLFTAIYFLDTKTNIFNFISENLFRAFINS